METTTQASNINRISGHGSAVIEQGVVSFQGWGFAVEVVIPGEMIACGLLGPGRACLSFTVVRDLHEATNECDR